jgi:hypothetical protein
LKALTTAIFSKVAGSTLNTDIGGRFYKGRAPQSPTFPYVVYFLVSDVPDNTFTEKLDDILMQFSLFSSASSSSEIEDMYTHLKTLYDDCSLTITGETLIWMKRQHAILMVDDFTTPAGTVAVWHYAVDYSIYTRT